MALPPECQLDRLADLVAPRKHRHRYHGVSAPNHKLRRAVTALAIGNIAKQREAATSFKPRPKTCRRSTSACCDGRRDEPADAQMWRRSAPSVRVVPRRA